MTKHNKNWSVRAPWDDELIRLERNFMVSMKNDPSRRAWRRVIEAVDPERIVGYACCQETMVEKNTNHALDESVRLIWDIRPAWRTSVAAEELLDEALAYAKESGCVRVFTCVVPGETLEELVRCRGFEEVSREEVWDIPVLVALAELEKRGGVMLAHTPVSVLPLEEVNIERVRRICGVTHLLTPERVVPVVPGLNHGFAPGLSFAVGEPEDPAAVLLGREYIGRGYLEVLARNPDAGNVSSAGVAALLIAFFRAVSALGLERVACVVKPGNISAMESLVRRVGGKRLEAVATFKLEMGALIPGRKI